MFFTISQLLVLLGLLKFLSIDPAKLILTMLLEQYRGGNSALVEQENDDIKETKFLT
jgi:hypothetical protein